MREKKQRKHTSRFTFETFEKYDFEQIRLEAGTWLIVCKEGNPIPSVKRLSA